MIRTITSGQVVFLPQINTGQLDQRYVLNSNILNLDSVFVTSGEFNALENKYVRITGNSNTINLNKGLFVSGLPLTVKSSGIFQSGLSIQGDLILNGRKVITLAQGDSFSTSSTSDII